MEVSTDQIKGKSGVGQFIFQGDIALTRFDALVFGEQLYFI